MAKRDPEQELLERLGVLYGYRRLMMLVIMLAMLAGVIIAYTTTSPDPNRIMLISMALGTSLALILAFGLNYFSRR